jgi:hypothetical protein
MTLELNSSFNLTIERCFPKRTTSTLSESASHERTASFCLALVKSDPFEEIMGRSRKDRNFHHPWICIQCTIAEIFPRMAVQSGVYAEEGKDENNNAYVVCGQSIKSLETVINAKNKSIRKWRCQRSTMELIEGFRGGGYLKIGAADTARWGAGTRKGGFVRSHPVATISCGKGSSLIGAAATV